MATATWFVVDGYAGFGKPTTPIENAIFRTSAGELYVDRKGVDSNSYLVVVGAKVDVEVLAWGYKSRTVNTGTNQTDTASIWGTIGTRATLDPE